MRKETYEHSPKKEEEENLQKTKSQKDQNVHKRPTTIDPIPQTSRMYLLLGYICSNATRYFSFYNLLNLGRLSFGGLLEKNS